MLHPYERRYLTRRGFVTGLAAGLGIGAVSLAILARRRSAVSDVAVTPTLNAAQIERMPGPFRGRVVDVHHPHVVDEQHQIDRPTVRRMMDTGMCAFTGADHPVEA